MAADEVRLVASQGQADTLFQISISTGRRIGVCRCCGGAVQRHRSDGGVFCRIKKHHHKWAAGGAVGPAEASDGAQNKQRIIAFDEDEQH